MTRVLAIALFAAGCLQIPEAPKPQCTVDSDCQTSLGEVCNAGTCYGGPPAGTFAATLTPPSERQDLTSSEIASIQLPANGDLGMFAFETPVRITGRLEAYCPSSTTCTNTSVAATVSITRAPLFPGGTGFSATTTSKGGLSHGTTSFSIAVPITRPGDPPYRVTFTPAGGGQLPPPNGSLSDAELAPPGSQTLSVTGDTDLGTITLGSATSPVLMGQLTDSGGHPLVKYRVVARGRLSTGGAITDVSTVAYTTTGAYSLTLSDSAIAPIAIVATPYDSNVTAPTLTLPALDAHSATHTLAQPANLGNIDMISIPITGLSGNGAVIPVAGAHVTVTGTYTAPIIGGANASLTAETTTDSNGLARLTILDGATLSASYTLSVVPPASSELGVVFGVALPLDTISGVRLPTRLALRGHVTDTSAKPVGKLSVTAKPSLRFSWSAPPDLAAFIAEIPPPTAVTDGNGDYVIYVDRSVDLFPDTLWGVYDLEFATPAGASLASWTLPELEIPRDPGLNTLDVAAATLPDTALLRAQLADPNHLRVSDGELRIFEISTDSSLCTEVMYPPADCVIPAQLAGQAASGDDGTLQLALPR